jgi:hypothetical protein
MINIFLPDSKGNGIKPGTVQRTDPSESIYDQVTDYHSWIDWFAGLM